jgi:leucyl/phenylalanyl-tRNA---protein transferase
LHPQEDQFVEGLLNAYRQGFFPMAEPAFGPHSPLFWLSPDPRGIMPLTEEEGFHIPRRLLDRIRRKPFVITCDEAFEQVIRSCAAPRWYEHETWISARIIELYSLMHRRGHAHSVEAWLERGRERTLVGGLYGLHIGSAFFAESKFCRPDLGGTDASKIVLVALVEHLRARGFRLLDVQMWNEHLDRFGCVEIPREQYLERLREAIALNVEWAPFSS